MSEIFSKRTTEGEKIWYFFPDEEDKRMGEILGFVFQNYLETGEPYLVTTEDKLQGIRNIICAGIVAEHKGKFEKFLKSQVKKK